MADILNDSLAVIRETALLSGDLKKVASRYFAGGIDVFDGLTAESLEAGFSG